MMVINGGGTWRGNGIGPIATDAFLVLAKVPSRDTSKPSNKSGSFELGIGLKEFILLWPKDIIPRNSRLNWII